MTDEVKPLIVDGEKVGDYSDSYYGFDKWCMATVESVSYTHLTLPTTPYV